MQYQLEVQVGELDGELGLVILGNAHRDWFDPSVGSQGLIHDIMEHPLVPLDNPYADELMATGAMYLVRYEGGYYPSRESGCSYRRSIEERDFVGTIEQVLRDESLELETASTRINDPNIYDFFKSIAQQGVDSWIKEETYNEEEAPEFDPKLPEYVCSWLCKGYSAAKKRYSRFDSSDLAEKFSEFERQVEPIFRFIEFTGQTFELSLVMESGNLTWKNTTDYGE